MSRRLAEQGRRIIGEPVTYRARVWSVVRCYQSIEGLVWFKETNPGHRFEAGLTAALARLVPDVVAAPIAVDRARGWLLTNDHGTTLDHKDVADQPTRCTVVRALARLQCSLLGHLEVGEHPGLVVLPPSAAGDRVRAVARDWAALPAGHPLHAESDMLERADQAAGVLDRCTAPLSGAVPLDLEINDVYAANICADRGAGTLQLRFFDFGNALWGHPFVTLHGFLDSVEEWNNAPLSSSDREALCDSYLMVWREHLHANPQLLHRDLAATRVLVHVHRLVSWLRLVPYADPTEIRTRAEIPRQQMASIAALAD
ncbi:hypothetical protein ABN034_07695 [Actinopolymorpha sp. B11F2]|uniref:hypothetical protein n=1 Tax=Actinopolymorpha sp. B11F2 TaxID=3160862 RepID=UPI0032E4A471